jgi:NitT/TauT family transport system substrate-binding protein
MMTASHRAPGGDHMRWARYLAIGGLAAVLLACAPGAPARSTGGESPMGAADTASAAGPGGSATAPAPRELEKIVFALTSISGNFIPHVVAQQRGFFREEGLDAEMPVLRANLVIAALTSGEADYSSSTSAAVRAALSGVPIRLVAVTVPRGTRRIMALPGVQSIEQLRGRTIAVNSIGGGPHNTAILGVEHYGIDSRTEVTWLAAGTGDTLTLAIQQGAAHAGVFSGPDIPRAEAQGFVTLARLDEIAPLPESGVTTSVAKLATQRDQVKRVLRAMMRALAYVKSNREGTLPSLMQHLSVTREEAIEAYDAAVQALGDDGTISEHGLRYTIESEKKQLEMVEDVPFGRVADFGPLYDVLRELSITPAAGSAR